MHHTRSARRRWALITLPFITLTVLLLGLLLAFAGLPQLIATSQAAPLAAVPLTPPGPNQLRINEVLRDPVCRGDGIGEYFELLNLSAGETFNLQGCRFSDAGTDVFTVTGSLPVAPGGYLVFCLNGNPSLNGGLDCDYDYAGLSLGNFDDELIISCDGSEVTRIEWDNGGWPSPEGASMMYCGPEPVNDGAGWLVSPFPINPGTCSASNTTDLGSPGRQNDCPPVLDAGKAVTPAGPVTYGQVLTYHITVSNTGAITAVSLVATDTHSVVGSQVLTGPVSFPVGNASFSYTYSVRPEDCFTTLRNSVLLTASNALRPGSSNEVTTPVTCLGPQYDIVKTASPSAVITRSAVLTFQVAFTNTGDLSDTVQVSEPGPTFEPALQATCASEPPGWPAPGPLDYGYLELGQAGSIAITCTVTARPALITQTLPLSNVVTAQCASYQPNCTPFSASAALTLTVLPSDGPTLNLSKTAGPSIALTQSGEITYGLSIRNSGDFTASLILTDSGPPALPGLALSCSSDPPGLPAPSGVDFGDLPAGDSLAVTLSCTAAVTQTTQPQTYTLPNLAVAACAGGICDPVSDSATLTVTVPELRPLLTLVKSAQPASQSTTGTATLTFTALITNSGDYTGTFLIDDPGPTIEPQGLGYAGCTPAVPYQNSVVLEPGEGLAPPLILVCDFPTAPSLVTQTYTVTNVVSVAISETAASGQAEASAMITVPALYPAIALAKSVQPAWQVATDTARITYTLRLTNSGDLTATFELMDPGPAPLPGLQLAGCTPAFPVEETLVLGPGLALSPPLSRACVFSVTQDIVAQVLPVANTATALISETGDSEHMTVTAVISVPLLTTGVSLSKVPDPAAVFAGEPVTYTYVVTNDGETYLAPITVSDDLLGQVCLVSAPLAPATATSCTATTTITTDTVNVGTVQAQPSRADGQAYATPPLITTDSATVTLLVPGIALEKTVEPEIVEAGLPLTYTFRVTNTGNVHLQPITVTDDVEGMICVLADGLAALASADCVLETVRFSHTLNVGTATGQPATADGLPLPVPPVSATDIAFVLVTAAPQVDLAVNKIGDPNPAPLGGAIVYSILITNTGPQEARSVRITDTLPTEVSFTAASMGCHHNGITPGGVVFCNVQPNPLPAGQSTLIVVATNVATSQPGFVTNIVTVDTTSDELNPVNNTFTETTYIGTPPDLQISKVATVGPVHATQVISYTLTVFNAGPGAAGNVLVTDELPDEVGFLQASAGCSHDDSGSGGTVSCAISPDPMPAQTSKALTIEVQMLSGLPGVITNTASATSNLPDPAPEDNHTSVSTFVPTCDVNADGQVDVADVQAVSGAFNATVPPALQAYDLHPSGLIDILDVVLAAQCWLEAN